MKDHKQQLTHKNRSQRTTSIPRAIPIYILIVYANFRLRNTKECSMSYRQSKLYIIVQNTSKTYHYSLLHPEGMNIYYLIYEQECFIRYKTRGASERFISDKARIASILKSFKSDPFFPILSVCLRKNFQYRCCISRQI